MSKNEEETASKNSDSTLSKKLPAVPLFGKWNLTEVDIADTTLTQYINLDAFQVPHTGGRHSKKRFGKRNTTNS